MNIKKEQLLVEVALQKIQVCKVIIKYGDK